eukprot:scaffold9905_cov117-Isochrysis_galbana.AAC.4
MAVSALRPTVVGYEISLSTAGISSSNLPRNLKFGSMLARRKEMMDKKSFVVGEVRIWLEMERSYPCSLR